MLDRSSSPLAVLESHLRRVPRWALLLAGFAALVYATIKASGGYEKIWRYEWMAYHRYTAMAILTGTLRLRDGVSSAGSDEQVFNGAVYTNWGFGVPLLEAPFHAIAAKWMKFHFFPDRAIFLAYVTAMIPFLWGGLDRLLALRERAFPSPLRRHVVSWAATLFVLTCALYPLTSCRFIVYEETIAYLVVFELLSLGIYLLAAPSWSAPAAAALAISSGIGLLVRPTGLFYMGAWGALIVLEGRSKRAVAAFVGAVAPFLGFWMFSNWLRTGSLFSPGYQNSLPFFDYHTPMVRFGSPCVDTPRHAWQVARMLFRALFFTVPVDMQGWMKECHLGFEERDLPSDSWGYGHEPFLGIGVLVVLGWMFLHHLVRRERRLASFVPYAAIVVLFGSYVYAGAGLVWRYMGDFWPFIALASVQYVRSLPAAANPLLGYRLAALLVACNLAAYSRIKPWLETVHLAEPNEVEGMWDDFTKARWSGDGPMPTSYSCNNRPQWPYRNGHGWNGDCSVDTFTNFYVGVPFKADDSYTLEFEAEGISSPQLRLYFNGRIYVAHRIGARYVANVRLKYERFTSPIAMGTIEWTRQLTAIPGVKLISIKLS